MPRNKKAENQFDVKTKWQVIETNPPYQEGLKRIIKSGRYEKIKAQIVTFKKVIEAGKVFSRNKSEIENLNIKVLINHPLAEYELKFRGADNNLRLLYSVIKSDTILYNEAEDEYQRYNLVVFMAIGTHSQVRTTASLVE